MSYTDVARTRTSSSSGTHRSTRNPESQPLSNRPAFSVSNTDSLSQECVLHSFSDAGVYLAPVPRTCRRARPRSCPPWRALLTSSRPLKPNRCQIVSLSVFPTLIPWRGSVSYTDFPDVQTCTPVLASSVASPSYFFKTPETYWLPNRRAFSVSDPDFLALGCV